VGGERFELPTLPMQTIGKTPSVSTFKHLHDTLMCPVLPRVRGFMGATAIKRLPECDPTRVWLAFHQSVNNLWKTAQIRAHFAI
jgi:hypothetical protein